MSDMPLLIPITEPECLRQAGIYYPTTYGGWQWAYRNRQSRGLDRAFVRSGRRILVDVAEYLRVLHSRRPQPISV